VNVSLRESSHYFRRARVDESAVIVDARAYYGAFYRAALQARRYILFAGWQFDTEVALLRGDDALDAPLPVSFLPFLEALCQKEEELRIYILAWDYSFVYALEREWLQDLKFALKTPNRLRFEFDRHPRYGASHHQKFVVIDGAISFAGGMDICDERWDDRGHLAVDPLRINAAGEPCRPNHEVQAAVVGEAAATLTELFRARWLAACGEELELARSTAPSSTHFDLLALTKGAALMLRAGEVCLSRTAVAPEGSVVAEIRTAYEAVLGSAERLIYIETQYFTSRSIASALLSRLRDETKTKLQIVVVLPRGADTGKEKFALGEAQSMVLGALEETARTTGHELLFLCSAIGNGEDTTFIHSKVLIVDDLFLSVGSANMTERSMGLDSELSLFWQANGDEALAADITNVRASLLAEHSGRNPEDMRAVDGLVGRIRQWISESSCRFLSCHYRPVEANAFKTLIFDPGGPPLLAEQFETSTRDEDRERLSSGSIRLRSELARHCSPSGEQPPDGPKSG
jgi:phospholipase D1/2